MTLAEAGYDVWLGNFRGTEYSEGHEILSVYNKKYWNVRWAVNWPILGHSFNQLNYFSENESNKFRIIQF